MDARLAAAVLALAAGGGVQAGAAETAAVASGREYWVDGGRAEASDTGPGTAAAPWKTLARAARAAELKPGDTVRIAEGVYREHVDITVSGEPGKPVTFAAAPGARVVIKGSELIRGPWTRVVDPKAPPENSTPLERRLWKVTLGEEFFADARFTGAYADPAKRWVSQVFWEDNHPLQMIGEDGIYKNDKMVSMVHVGKGLADMIPQSFWFDRADSTLYINVSGEPGWYAMEVGVRGFALTVSQAHDVVVCGLEMRHNRQPGGQWPLVAVSGCQRVVLEECRIAFADFVGLGMHSSRECGVRRCDISNNGAIGLAMGVCEDVTVEGCSLLFNNYRHFYGDWGVSAGTKCIPGNKRITVRGCEAAYNTEAEGIWFDTDNEDIRILDNVCHHNGDCGIFFEINKAGGVIAGNLVYANLGRGIYVSGSQNTWVVHNTVAENGSGIVAMTRGKDEPARRTRVLNNLLIRNYISAQTTTRGSDLTLEMPDTAEARAQMESVSDANVYANNAWTPFMRHNWNDNNTLEQWRARSGQDAHSRRQAVPYQAVGTGFRLLATTGLEGALPLPEAVTRAWTPRTPQRIGADRTAWPTP